MILLAIDIALIFLAGIILAKIALRMHRHGLLFTKDLLIGVFAIAYVVPLIGFNVIGYEEWTAYRKISRALYLDIQQYDVQIKYRVLVGYAVFFLYYFGSSAKLEAALKSRKVSIWRAQIHSVPMLPAHPTIHTIYIGCWVILLLAPLSVILSPSPTAYLTYITPSQRFESPQALRTHAVIAFCCLASVGAYSLVLWTCIRKKRKVFDMAIGFAFFLVVIACYIYGKRSIVFLVMIATAGICYLEGVIRITHFALGILAMIVFVQLYSMYFKGNPRDGFAYGDLFRDYTLLPVIAGASATEHDSMPRGSGFIFQWLFWIPRDIWPGKPYPTAAYVTPWILGRDEEVGWRFGLGYMEDGLGNFGLVGPVVYLAAIALISRLVDRFIYTKNNVIYAIFWLPLTYGCAFAFSVLIKHFVFIVVPVLLLARVMTRPENWHISSAEDHMKHPSE